MQKFNLQIFIIELYDYYFKDKLKQAIDQYIEVAIL